MAKLIFLKIEGIDGEEPIGETPEKKMIRLSGYSHSLDMELSASRPSLGPDATLRRSYCRHGLFAVQKGLDLATPKLLQACANGVIFPNVAIHVCTLQDVTFPSRKKVPKPILSIVMTDAIIAHHSYGFQDKWPTEQISFQYTSIGWNCNWYKPKDGSSTAIPTGWDGSSNEDKVLAVPAAVKFS